MTKGSDQDQRLEALETKLAYQERLLEELNKLVIDQQSTLQAVTQKLREMHRRIEDHASMIDKPPSEKPPHY